MAVSENEQEKRRGLIGILAFGAFISMPLIGDIVGIFVVAAPLYGQTLVKSQNRMIDLAILTALIILFCPIAYSLTFVSISSLPWAFFFGGVPFGLKSIWLVRFLILIIGLPWYYRRIDDGNFF